jgi:hypothetical protein
MHLRRNLYFGSKKKLDVLGASVYSCACIYLHVCVMCCVVSRRVTVLGLNYS